MASSVSSCWTAASIPQLFWIVQVLIGSLLPLALLYLHPRGKSRRWIGIACALVILGGLAQMYVIIIGGQAYPLEMFPGIGSQQLVLRRRGGAYSPSLPEVLLGIGGVAIALAAVVRGHPGAAFPAGEPGG